MDIVAALQNHIMGESIYVLLHLFNISFISKIQIHNQIKETKEKYFFFLHSMILITTKPNAEQFKEQNHQEKKLAKGILWHQYHSANNHKTNRSNQFPSHGAQTTLKTTTRQIEESGDTPRSSMGVQKPKIQEPVGEVEKTQKTKSHLDHHKCQNKGPKKKGGNRKKTTLTTTTVQTQKLTKKINKAYDKIKRRYVKRKGCEEAYTI